MSTFCLSTLTSLFFMATCFSPSKAQITVRATLSDKEAAPLIFKQIFEHLRHINNFIVHGMAIGDHDVEPS